MNDGIELFPTRKVKYGLHIYVCILYSIHGYDGYLLYDVVKKKKNCFCGSLALRKENPPHLTYHVNGIPLMVLELEHQNISRHPRTPHFPHLITPHKAQWGRCYHQQRPFFLARRLPSSMRCLAKVTMLGVALVQLQNWTCWNFRDIQTGGLESSKMMELVRACKDLRVAAQKNGYIQNDELWIPSHCQNTSRLPS